MLQNFDRKQTERVSIIKNWLGRQGLQLLETLTQAEKEACNEKEDLYKILNKKFMPRYIENIKSLQFHNLVR